MHNVTWCTADWTTKATAPPCWRAARVLQQNADAVDFPGMPIPFLLILVGLGQDIIIYQLNKIKLIFWLQAEVETRVMSVCKAFDKINVDKVKWYIS